MIVIPSQPAKMTVEEYFQWEPQQKLRYEYDNGEVFAMTGGTIPHNDIALNLYSTLRPHLRSRGCRANVCDVKVQTNSKGLFYYPDVVVSCNPQDQNARTFIQSPTIIAEVLSSSTSAKDRSDKLINYLKITSLQEYLLIDSQKISVEGYCREEGSMWLYSHYLAGDAIALSSLDLEFPIEILYEGVKFETE